MFAELPVALSTALFALLGVSAVDPAAASPICEDSVFFGAVDPGGADLCDPTTDPALIDGVAQCSFQGQEGFWCCDGADCTCFCDEADANAYCGGFLGQATCES